MNVYQTLIIDTLGCTESDGVEIEDYMRHTIFNSTLSWQTKEQLQQGAQEAWEDIQYMRTPEGKAYMASLTA